MCLCGCDTGKSSRLQSSMEGRCANDCEVLRTSASLLPMVVPAPTSVSALKLACLREVQEGSKQALPSLSSSDRMKIRDRAT